MRFDKIAGEAGQKPARGTVAWHGALLAWGVMTGGGAQAADLPFAPGTGAALIMPAAAPVRLASLANQAAPATAAAGHPSSTATASAALPQSFSGQGWSWMNFIPSLLSWGLPSWMTGTQARAAPRVVPARSIVLPVLPVAAGTQATTTLPRTPGVPVDPLPKVTAAQPATPPIEIEVPVVPIPKVTTAQPTTPTTATGVPVTPLPKTTAAQPTTPTLAFLPHAATVSAPAPAPLVAVIRLAKPPVSTSPFAPVTAGSSAAVKASPAIPVTVAAAPAVTAAPAPATVATPAPPAVTAAAAYASDPFEKEELLLISQYRQQEGLNKLIGDARLHALALSHSQDMAARQHMDHNGFSQRLISSGSTRCVENVAWNYMDPWPLFNAWLNSKEHNANMLDAAITRAGVAIVDGYATFLACH